MAKRVTGQIKLQIPAGQANPAPPVGPALGQQGVNIMDFCKAFNEATQDKAGLVVPVVISVYQDKSFDFITKSPPAATLLKRAAGLAKGSGVPNRERVGTVTKDQVQEIVEMKREDLNARDDEAAANIIMGTARSMGIEIEGVDMGLRLVDAPTEEERAAAAAAAEAAEGEEGAETEAEAETAETAEK